MTVRRVVTGFAVGLALLGLAGRGGAGETPPVPAKPVPVHADPVEFENALLDTMRAFVRSDLPAARAALDRMEAGCRRLEPDEPAPYPKDLVVFDQAFHATLDRAREYSLKGPEDRAFEQMYWIQKSCRICHDLGRAAKLPGLSPARPGAAETKAP